MLKKFIVNLLAASMIFSCSAASAAPAADTAKLQSIVAGQYNDYVADLQTIVNIDSGTGNQEGSARMADFLKDKLEALGGTVEFRANDKGTYVIGRFKGDGTLRVLLLAHTDTVFDKGEAVKRPFRLDEQTGLAYGPGVGDDKAIVTQTVYLLKAIKDADIHNYGEIILYYAAEEETGSAFNNQLIAELSRQADVCFVLDTAKPDWGVVTQRKGHAKYRIEVQGLAGHAGTPYRGINAVTELVNQLSLIGKLASPQPEDPKTLTPAALRARGVVDHGQFIPQNTINVGIIGTTNKVLNKIPDQAFAELETRFYKMAEGERLDREIKAMAAKPVVSGAKVSVIGGITIGPMEKTPQVQTIVDMYREIVKRDFKADIVEWSAGGLTDGNVSSRYVPTIDSVGVEAFNVHTDREYADLNTVGPRTVAMIELLQELIAKWPIK
jgi:Acetylornithine deacetylase/Succinyl-diaminopimelate desuccinylase and related deacylases